jgi:hypothetical protein
MAVKQITERFELMHSKHFLIHIDKMNTKTHTFIGTPKEDTKSVTPTKGISYLSIGSALYTRGGNMDHTNEEMDHRGNTGAPTAN